MFGLGFHAFNIIKRPGELTFGNFFYGAPIGAPAALVLASALNVAADALSKPDARFGPVSLSSGRVLGALTAAGVAGTRSGERRLGTERVRTCRASGPPRHSKKK